VSPDSRPPIVQTGCGGAVVASSVAHLTIIDSNESFRIIAPSHPEPASSRIRRLDPSIEALRGIAIILVVAAHVIGLGNRGLRLGHDSLFLALEDVRAPLFTLIAGYVYAMVPVAKWRDYPHLVKGKSRRLLLPLLTVGTVMYLLERLIPNTGSGARHLAFWRVYIFGFEHLWFLQSIFIVFLVVGILDSSAILASRTQWAVATAVAVVLFVFVHVPREFDVFTVSGALRLLPFFLIGYGLRRYSVFDLRGAPAIALTGAFAAAFTIRMLVLFHLYRPDEYVERMIEVAVGGTALILIYSARKLFTTKLLVWIGGFSMGIYLLHVFATAGTREILESLGMHQAWALFVMGTAVGVAAPIAFQLLFRNMRFIRTILLGERWKPSGRRSTAHAERTQSSPVPEAS
jgi:peptidoglycan/LPS O-acetylase OafA/YrhL